VFISAPTVISWVDNSIDVSIFYSNSEEEENGQETNTNKEVLFFEDLGITSYYSSDENKSALEYYYKNYPKPHLNLISPPPERGLL
jgi:hypothetical protein